jgi:hypothetical protein
MWYSTRCFKLLDFKFAFRSTLAELVRYVDTAYRHCVTDDVPQTTYSFVDSTTSGGMHQIHIDNRVALEGVSPYEPFQHFFWHVNQRAMRANGDLVLVHSAVASFGGDGVLLPARMEAGKTTLVAALIARGFSYLSDEAAAIYPSTQQLNAFPKPLSIDAGSFGVLSHLQPKVTREIRPYIARQWQVSPESIREDSVAAVANPTLIVFPQYKEGSETEFRKISRQESLMALLQNTFDFQEHGRRNFDALAEIVARCDSYRLTSSELTDACDRVSELFTSSKPGDM